MKTSGTRRHNGGKMKEGSILVLLFLLPIILFNLYILIEFRCNAYKQEAIDFPNAPYWGLICLAGVLAGVIILIFLILNHKITLAMKHGFLVAPIILIVQILISLYFYKSGDYSIYMNYFISPEYLKLYVVLFVLVLAHNAKTLIDKIRE